MNPEQRSEDWLTRLLGRRLERYEWWLFWGGWAVPLFVVGSWGDTAYWEQVGDILAALWAAVAAGWWVLATAGVAVWIWRRIRRRKGARR